jgi:sorbitol/mannitol transport system substrate-binding protein
MKNHINQPHILVLIILLFFFGSAPAMAKKQARLAASEHEPYISKSSSNRGYVYELVEEVFKKAGYELVVEFYPLTRAKELAKTGKVDGLLPAYYEESLAEYFLYSDPFPGDSIGLLKKKSLQVVYSVDPSSNLKEAIRELQQYEFGIVRGTSIAPVFDQSDLLKKQFVTKDLQNLDKLDWGRIHFAVMDQYTAANLMVKERPHLIGQLEFMRPSLVSNEFHIAFSKKAEGHLQMYNDFNQSLQALIQDGTLAKILAKYGAFPQKASKPGKVKLTIGTVNNEDMIVMQGLSKQFEDAHPHIELEWRILDENTLRQRLLSDLAISDGQFDIMTIGAYEAPIWSKLGWLTPLENLPDTYDVQDLLRPVRDSLSYENNLYALPFYAESTMTFYRKDLFKKAGMTMSSHPTYDDIKKYAAAIHKPEDEIYGVCLRGKAGWGENMALLGIMVNTYGGQWFNQKWEPQLNSPQWKNAVSTYKELLIKYGPPDSTNNGFNENRVLFSEGHCGMWIDATVAAGMVFNSELSEVHSNVGFARAPIAVTSKGASWLWTWALAVPDSSKNKAEAIEFITWATSKDYIRQVAKSQGWVSVPPGTRTSTYTNRDYQKAAPFADFVLRAINDANPLDSTLKPKPYTGIQFVGIPEFPAIGHNVGLNMAKVIEGKMSVDEALQVSQDFVDNLMKKSGYQ